MRRFLTIVLLCLVAAALGAWLAFLKLGLRQKLPDPPALVMQMREVARLETLDVTLYKKVSFEPGPVPAGSLWGDLANWARFTIRPPRGKAIIFGDAHLGFDLAKIGEQSLRVTGDQIEVVLPPVQVKVSLKPAETEVIGSNLDSAQTAQLFELAREAFQREVQADQALREKARASAERSLRGLFMSLGFRAVRFVDALPAGPGAG